MNYTECDSCHRLYPPSLVRRRPNGLAICVECVGDQPPGDGRHDEDDEFAQ